MAATEPYRPVVIPDSQKRSPAEWLPSEVSTLDASAYVAFRDGRTVDHVDTTTPEGIAFRLLAEEAEAAYRTLVRVSAEMDEFAPNRWQ